MNALTKPVSFLKNMRRNSLFLFLCFFTRIFDLYAFIHEERIVRYSRPCIRITMTQVQEVTHKWVQQLGRPLTPSEKQCLIRDSIRKKVLYQEGMHVGLGGEDPGTQHHLEQKLHFLALDLAEKEEPSPETLKQFYDKNRANYIIPEKAAFSHVYLNPGERGGNTLVDSERLLQYLAIFEPVPLDQIGDVFPLQRHYPLTSEKDISLLYGRVFTKTLFAIKGNQWQGPLHSTFGLHLVRVTDRTEKKEPHWEEIREKVYADWKAETYRHREEQFFEQLQRKYEVIIEDPPFLDNNFHIR